MDPEKEATATLRPEDERSVQVSGLVEAGRARRRLFDQPGFEEAVPLLREAIELAPDRAEAYAELSETYSYWGLRRENSCHGFRRETRRVEYQSLYDLAYDYAAMTLRLAPELAAAHRAMAVSLRRGAKADAERRLREARRAVELDPDDPESLVELWRAEGYDPDDPALRRALEAAPDLVIGHLDLGASLIERGRLDEALHELRKALRANPRCLQAYYDVALALDRKGRRAEALALLGKARLLRPGDPLIEQGFALLGEVP
ncbi:MAG: tetratricopeptide repeat protein [Elusimicrobia bacterium]|nr:tetratricopeptide repeat protein [Elusimicrobiota bacterium]